MATEIAKANKQPLNLSTNWMTPQELQSHGSKVGLRLEIISRKYDRFGWDQISDEVRTLLRADWTAALLNYSTEEIDAAITEYVNDTKNRKAAHEGQIRDIIIKNRHKATLPEKPKTYVPVENPITPEAHAKLMEEFGSVGTPRKFTDTPKEKE